jgi:hypothetical protein
MEVGEIYTITLGRYTDKYLVTAIGYHARELHRVRTPKTKIDSLRLPETISIAYFGQSVVKTKKKIIGKSGKR